MMKYFIICVQLIFTINCTLSQANYDYNWVMGYNLFYKNPIISFNNLDSVHIKYENIALPFGRSGTCISDKNGNLALYFNGCQLADGNHNLIEDDFNPGYVYDNYCPPNGFGYTAGSQSNLILPLPEQEDKYLIIHSKLRFYFVVDSFNFYLDANYSIIDASGSPTVVQKKNIPLLSDTIIGGVYTAVKHRNGIDWWVIAQDRYYTNGYYKVLITKDTVRLINYQNIGLNFKRNGQGGSQACFSPDGTKYATYSSPDGLFLLDFDRQTGSFKDFKNVFVPDNGLISGCAFSPNGRYIYLSNTQLLYQVDLEADSLVAELVAEWDGFREPGLGLPVVFGPMQTGPDCRIYVSTGRSPEYWGVIMKPDEKGKACQMLQHCIEFKNNLENIPHFPNFRLDTPYPYCDPNKVLITGTHDPWVTAVSRSLIIHPNPGHEQMTVTIPYQAQLPVHIDIHDTNGRTLHHSRYDDNNDINVSTLDWPSGLYLVHLTDRIGNRISSKWVRM